MTTYLIGTGGWAYFQIPGKHPLESYAKAFNFVEVNSTFYEIPEIRNVELWRRIVPKTFEFTVRCNKKLTHELKFKPKSETYDILNKMIRICKILDAEILHFQTPPSFHYNKQECEIITNFFKSIKITNTRIALENRNSNQEFPLSFIKTLQDLNIIHCVDLLKENEPAYKSDILYTRLFGKGDHNIYQPLDRELRQVDKAASKDGIEKAIITMHSNRMFKDAARFRIYKETGKFPMVTKSTGLESVAEVLKEDTNFPSTKKTLVHHQGWKLIDLTKNKRVHASDLLQKLPERTYDKIDDVIQTLGAQNLE